MNIAISKQLRKVMSDGSSMKEKQVASFIAVRKMIVATSGVAKRGGFRGHSPPWRPWGPLRALRRAPREGSKLPKGPARAPKGPARALKGPEKAPKGAHGPLKT